MSCDPVAAAERILQRCDALARYSEAPTELTRTFLSPPMHGVHRELRGWLEAAGCTVRLDGVGNLIGRYAGVHPDAPVLVIGSHLDTVRNAGRYDGVLGVLVGVAVIEALAGERLPIALELVGFSEEEGVRFGTPFIGSRGYLGELDEATLARRDEGGVSVAEAISAFGLTPAPGRPPERALGFVEVHIEQGPVLDAAGKPLGVVTAIQGSSRAELALGGQAGHAGTTPMALRRDALAGAAELVLAAERLARAKPGLVATVGRLTVRPGAINVIPGEATLALDVRHAEDAARQEAMEQLRAEAERVATARNLALSWRMLLEQPAMPLDPELSQLLSEAAGPGALKLPSGAGHDAMVLAEAMPAAMLFIRSPGGLSHHPDEAVRCEDVAEAVRTVRAFVGRLAERHA